MKLLGDAPMTASERSLRRRQRQAAQAQTLRYILAAPSLEIAKLAAALALGIKPLDQRPKRRRQRTQPTEQQDADPGGIGSDGEHHSGMPR